MTSVETWAINYINNIAPSFGLLSDAEKLQENFFTSGRLDSIGLMDLLLDAEAEFEFAFTPEAFQDRRIQNIQGLSEVINELIEAAC